LWIQRKYISLLSSSVRNFKRKDENLFNFSCPICNDSENNKSRARGYIYRRGQSFFYRCHNCGHSTTFANFLRTLNPELFKEYRFEQYRFSNTQPSITKVIEKKEEKNNIVLETLFERISSLSEKNDAKQYLYTRKIPEKHFHDLFYTEDLNLLKNEFSKYKEINFLPEPRILIPIRNRQKRFIGVTARAVFKSRLRYINMIYNEDEPLIYNLENVDFSKHIFVTEGAFDSMFLDNCLAVDGADFNKLNDIVPKSQVTIIYDNQPRNRELVRRIKQIADNGWKLCVWPNWVKEKDINEMILAGRTSDEITEIIITHTFESLTAKLKLSDWAKV
jgi:hypothetical protein